MYSSKFLKAFEYLLKHEGGYVNDKADPGGETRYGASCKAKLA
jgi:lysozyme family protein